jgi:hypothetical protein
VDLLELEDKVSDGKILDVEEALVLVEDKDMLTPEHFESPPNSSKDSGRSIE